MKVFVDSDVIISSLISDTGVASELINNFDIKKVVSNLSIKELEIVKTRLNINKPLPKLETVTIDNVIKYSVYSIDPNDAYIVAGAKQAKVKFLITYNLKHYKIDKIKRELDIIIMTPGMFLQYLRLSDKIDL